MAKVNEFVRRINVIAQGVEKNAGKVQREVALAIDRVVVTETPVDKGVARSNWRVGLGNAQTSAIPAFVPGQDGSTGAQNIAAALALGSLEISKHKPGQDIYISNNLPYIERLNEGYSPQAAPGYIEAAVEKGASVARNSKVIK